MTIPISEVLRYLGASAADEAAWLAVEQTAEELAATLAPRFVYKVFSVEHTDSGAFLPEAGLTLLGNMAKTMLQSCGQAALLCCTLGAEFERLLRMTQARDMAKAAILNACGSAYAEAGCDKAEKEIASRYPGMYLTDRFSPGYGDLPLTLQPVFIAALDAGRRLGVTVMDSLIMLPAKTVTAVIGLSELPQPARIRGCGFCALKENCAYRERGTHCGI